MGHSLTIAKSGVLERRFGSILTLHTPLSISHWSVLIVLGKPTDAALSIYHVSEMYSLCIVVVISSENVSSDYSNHKGPIVLSFALSTNHDLGLKKRKPAIDRNCVVSFYFYSNSVFATLSIVLGITYSLFLISKLL